MLIMAVVMIAAVSCEKYDDGRPEKNIRDSFADMYPDAKDVDWDFEGGYWKVSFETGTGAAEIDHEAWYDKSGNWVLTETECPLYAVPQVYKDYLAADEVYGAASFKDDDAEFIQTPDAEYYRFDLFLNGVEVKVNVFGDGAVLEGGLVF